MKYYILYTNITTNPILFIFIIFQSTAHDPKWTPRHIFVYSSPPLSSVFLFTSMICEVLYTSLIVFLVSASLLLVSVPSAPLSSALFSFPWCSSPLHLSLWWSLLFPSLLMFISFLPPFPVFLPSFTSLLSVPLLFSLTVLCSSSLTPWCYSLIHLSPWCSSPLQLYHS